VKDELGRSYPSPFRLGPVSLASATFTDLRLPPTAPIYARFIFSSAWRWLNPKRITPRITVTRPTDTDVGPGDFDEPKRAGADGSVLELRRPVTGIWKHQPPFHCYLLTTPGALFYDRGRIGNISVAPPIQRGKGNGQITRHREFRHGRASTSGHWLQHVTHSEVYWTTSRPPPRRILSPFRKRLRALARTPIQTLIEI